MTSFRRLSGAGASALSIWELRATNDALVELLGSGWPQEVGKFKLTRHSFLFDEALCWCRQVAQQHGGDFIVEIHLHGGFGVAAALRELLAQHGWTEQAPAKLELFDLSHATSPLAARVFAARRNQAWQEYFKAMSVRDHAQRTSACEAIQVWNEWGKILRVPPTVLLAGPPNAGKSTLFNTWLQEQRVTSHAAAGTTRDLVSARCSLGAHELAFAVELTDSAGLWENATEVDHDAVLMTHQAVREAWRVVWIFDAQVAPSAGLLDLVRQRPRSDLLIVNRTDLPPTWDPQQVLPREFMCAQHQRHGSLIQKIEQRLLAQLGAPPPVGQLVALSAEERASLEA